MHASGRELLWGISVILTPHEPEVARGFEPWSEQALARTSGPVLFSIPGASGMSVSGEGLVRR